MGKLSHQKIVALEPRTKPYRVADGAGLNLLVSRVGGKSWQGRYRYAGRENIESLGQWPLVSLAKAREKWLRCRVQLADGIDPAAEARAERIAARKAAANTWALAWAEWIKIRGSNWGGHRAAGVASRYKNYLAPALDPVPLSAPDLPDRLLAVLRRIEEAGHLSVSRVLLADCGAFAEFCIASRYVNTDFTIGMGQLLMPAQKTESHPALTKPDDVGRLIRDIFALAREHVRDVFLMAAMVFVRANELCLARWCDVDLTLREWRVSTKTGAILVVPLPDQAMAILNKIAARGRRSEYIFLQHNRDKPLNRKILTDQLFNMGYSGTHSMHGFRAMARTVLDETLRQDVRFIEMQLGHVVKDHLGTAYNRTVFIEDRRLMLQLWANWLYQFNEVQK